MALQEHIYQMFSFIKGLFKKTVIWNSPNKMPLVCFGHPVLPSLRNYNLQAMQKEYLTVNKAFKYYLCNTNNKGKLTSAEVL